jgi:hypothetical protein
VEHRDVGLQVRVVVTGDRDVVGPAEADAGARAGRGVPDEPEAGHGMVDDRIGLAVAVEVAEHPVQERRRRGLRDLSLSRYLRGKHAGEHNGRHDGRGRPAPNANPHS